MLYATVSCVVFCFAAVSVLQYATYVTAKDSGLSWTLQEVHPGQATVVQARGRGLLSDLPTVKGLPVRFTIRPMVDTSLCVHRAQLATPGGLLSRAVAAARARSGLPPTDPDDVQEYGSSRLVLLPCANSATDTFTAEALLGRFYFNNGTNYRQGFLKPSADNNVCVYGVNATYTDGHPVFGVSSTLTSTTYTNDSSAPDADDADDADAMDWFDEYTFDYAPYIRYGYDPATMVTNGTFVAPNPLPVTMLDASGWGPFRSGWGPCMRNPTLDTAVPQEDPASELALRYHGWAFLDVSGTASVSHLPHAARSDAFALLTLGPDRPQPDVSPLAGHVDAGDLSAALGGSDKPYGTGYSSLVSNELCMTAHTIKEGAQVRLAPCNPVQPSLEQVFLITRRQLSAKAAARKAAKAAAAPSASGSASASR